MENSPIRSTISIFNTVMILLTILFTYLLIAIWPTSIGLLSVISLFGYSINSSQDSSVLISVGIAGSFGSILCILTTMKKHLEINALLNKDLITFSIKPIIGLILAIIYYTIILSGLFIFNIMVENINSIILSFFIVFGGTVGYYSEYVYNKLEEFIELLL